MYSGLAAFLWDEAILTMQEWVLSESVSTILQVLVAVEDLPLSSDWTPTKVRVSSLCYLLFFLCCLLVQNNLSVFQESNSNSHVAFSCYIVSRNHSTIKIHGIVHLHLLN